MKVVLLAAVFALLDTTMSLAAELKTPAAPVERAYACVDLRRAQAPTNLPGLSPGLCCNLNAQCAQFISTDRLPRPVQGGRT